MTTPQISDYLFSQNPSLTGFSGFIQRLGRSRAKKPLCAFYRDLWTATAERVGAGEEAVRETLTSLKLSKTDVNRVAKRLTVCSACASLCESELRGWERPDEDTMLAHLQRIQHTVISDDEGSITETINSMTAVLRFFENLSPEEARLIHIAERLTGEKSGYLVEEKPRKKATKAPPLHLQLTDRDKETMFILSDRVKDSDQRFMKAFLSQIPTDNLNGITRTLKIGFRLMDVLFTEVGGSRILINEEHISQTDCKKILEDVEILKKLAPALRLRLLEMQVRNRIIYKSLTAEAAQTQSMRYCDLILKALDKVRLSEDCHDCRPTIEAFEVFRFLPLIFQHLSTMQSLAVTWVVRPENDAFINMALNALNGVGLTLARRSKPDPATAA